MVTQEGVPKSPQMPWSSPCNAIHPPPWYYRQNFALLVGKKSTEDGNTNLRCHTTPPSCLKWGCISLFDLWWALENSNVSPSGMTSYLCFSWLYLNGTISASLLCQCSTDCNACLILRAGDSTVIDRTGLKRYVVESWLHLSISSFCISAVPRVPL